MGPAARGPRNHPLFWPGGTRHPPARRVARGPAVRAGQGGHRPRGGLRRSFFWAEPPASGGDGPAAAGAAGAGLGGPGANRPPASALRGAGGRVRGGRQQFLLPAARAGPPGRRAAGRVPGDGREREGLRRHPRGLRPQPARASRERPVGLLDGAAGRGPGRAEPARRAVRGGAGGRGQHSGAPARRLPAPGRRHAEPRRPLPALRRPGPGHGIQRRRGRGAAETPGRRPARRRRRAGRRPGRGREQRRRRQGQLCGAQRGRAGRRHRRGAGRRPRGAGHHRLRGGPRHRHPHRRPHRAGRPAAGLRGRAGGGQLRAGLGQKQFWPPHGGGRRGGPHQSRAGPAAPAAAGHAALRRGQPAAEPGRQPVLRQCRPARLAGPGRRAAAGGRQLVWRGRHQRARGAGSGSPARRAGS